MARRVMIRLQLDLQIRSLVRRGVMASLSTDLAHDLVVVEMGGQKKLEMLIPVFNHSEMT